MTSHGTDLASLENPVATLDDIHLACFDTRVVTLDVVDLAPLNTSVDHHTVRHHAPDDFVTTWIRSYHDIPGHQYPDVDPPYWTLVEEHVSKTAVKGEGEGMRGTGKAQQ